MSEDFRMFKEENTKPMDKNRKPVKANKNTWTDDGLEEIDDIDQKIERKINTKPREKISQREVVCSICGKKVKVPPSLTVSTYYRCERCVGSGR